jgi:hypothetical protein
MVSNELLWVCELWVVLLGEDEGMSSVADFRFILELRRDSSDCWVVDGVLLCASESFIKVYILGDTKVLSVVERKMRSSENYLQVMREYIVIPEYTHRNARENIGASTTFPTGVRNIDMHFSTFGILHS